MYSTLLHATDLNENHYALCSKSLALAKSLKAKIYFLHILEVPPSIQIAQGLGFTEVVKPSIEDASIVMKTLADALLVPEDQFLVKIGSVTDTIVNTANTLHCDLIIIGAHTQGGFIKMIQDHAENIQHQKKFDVLTLND